MTTDVENQSTELHPKLSKFLVCLGSFLLVFSLAFVLIDKNFFVHLGYMFLSVAWIVLGLKLRLAPKYISFKLLDGLTAISMLIGVVFFGYDFIFNVLPNF